MAATNVDFDDAIARGRIPEDLYYRLSQVPIQLPPLRQRAGDVHLLFRKFTTDFSEQYRMPPLSLDDEAIEMLEHYPWPGNIRQLKNVTEQMSILETNRRIDADTLLGLFAGASPEPDCPAPQAGRKGADGMDEREILYKVLFDMKGDLNDLKQLVMSLMKNGGLQEEKRRLNWCNGCSRMTSRRAKHNGCWRPASVRRTRRHGACPRPQGRGASAGRRRGPVAAGFRERTHPPRPRKAPQQAQARRRGTRHLRAHLVPENQGIRFEMTTWLGIVVLAIGAMGLAGCGVYSPYGAQTSGASTFAWTDFEPAHPLVSTTAAQSLSEALRDRIQRQSTLRLWKRGS